MNVLQIFRYELRECPGVIKAILLAQVAFITINLALLAVW